MTRGGGHHGGGRGGGGGRGLLTIFCPGTPHSARTTTTSTIVEAIFSHLLNTLVTSISNLSTDPGHHFGHHGGWGGPHHHGPGGKHDYTNPSKSLYFVHYNILFL